MATMTAANRLVAAQLFYTQEHLQEQTISIIPFYQNTPEGQLVPVHRPPGTIIVHGGAAPLPTILNHPYKLPHDGNPVHLAAAVAAVQDFMLQPCYYDNSVTWQNVFDQCLGFLHHHAPNYPAKTIEKGRGIVTGKKGGGTQLKKDMPIHHNNLFAYIIGHFAFKGPTFDAGASIATLGEPYYDPDMPGGGAAYIRGREIYYCFVVPLLVMVKQIFNPKIVWGNEIVHIVSIDDIRKRVLKTYGSDQTARARKGIWSETYVLEEIRQNRLTDGDEAGNKVCMGVYYPYVRLYLLFNPRFRFNRALLFLMDGEEGRLGQDISVPAAGTMLVSQAGAMPDQL